MLIIPAAAARQLARMPEGMVALTAVIGSISVITGLSAAYRFDTPTAPAIVCVSLGLFCVFSILGTVKHR